MKIKEILSEAPIVDYEPLGNFEKPGSFNDRRDKQLIKNPKHEQKVLKFFQNTIEDFRVFPVNAPGIRSFTETGEVSEQYLRNILQKYPDIAERILEGHDQHITIAYVSNTGADKVVMTPWIMAHRFGHAIQATRRGSVTERWNETSAYFYEEINRVFNEVYGLQELRRNSRYPNEYYNALFNAIGTQRSSRQALITRPAEFIYELFAQYLQSSKITLNALPRTLPYGKAAWGHKASMNANRENSDRDLYDELGSLERTLEIMFDDVLNACVGKIFVM